MKQHRFIPDFQGCRFFIVTNIPGLSFITQLRVAIRKSFFSRVTGIPTIGDLPVPPTDRLPTQDREPGGPISVFAGRIENCVQR